jgi:hypothetical protein
VTKDNAGQLMYLRSERQTLRRLPKSNSILFTIKTYMTKIEDVCQNDADMAKRLAGAVRNWPPEMIEYKVILTTLYIFRIYEVNLHHPTVLSHNKINSFHVLPYTVYKSSAS